MTNKDGLEISTEPKSKFSMNPANAREDQLIVRDPPEGIDPMLPAMAGAATKMSRDDAIEAAREAGMQTIDIGKWGGYAKIGQYLQELGAVKVAAGQYAYHNQMRRKVMQLCRRAMGKAQDPEHVAKLAEQINKLLDSSDATIKEILKFVHTGVIKEQNEKPSVMLPPRGAPIVAVQVNNSVVESKQER